MKRFYCAIILALLSLGCMNISEDIDISKNGSGTYSEEIDMSSLLAFISAAASMDSSAENSSSIPDMDSSFSLKDVADTSTSLTPEEKKLLQNATIRVVANQADNVFKMQLTFPFSNMKDLEKILAMNSGKSSMDLAMKGAGLDKSMPSDGNDKEMPDLMSVYTTTCSKGVIDKKMDEEKWKSMQQDEQITQMQQSTEMMQSYTYTTTIHLPSPAKKLAGDKAALSADKKTVIIQGSIADMTNHPEVFAYHVEY
jgi:hypothetical protein